MNITATLIGQILTFAVLVWFIKGVLWEPMIKVLEDRKRKIADGLEAAERGQHSQELAEQRAKERLLEAKKQGAEIINQAQKRAGEIVDEAKVAAREEAERIKQGAQADIVQETNRAREQLRQQVSKIAVQGAERLLEREVDEKANAKLLDELAAQI
ncbi:MAG: F0F1 ATP synthase subunit B [Gammaproteobacteria bacterium]|jgi:F-type H+-transporting ATPase subunit b|nr:F0F1 ATP synthase subunit B [Gammaproteobacteria bacterium]